MNIHGTITVVKNREDGNDVEETNILVVDDEKEIADLLEIYLISDGFQVLKTYSAKEGLRILEEKKIDLVLLDVMMPDMNGFQVLQEIRKKNNVPVLMLTAKSDEEDKVSGLRLGADDYLTKPFSMKELLARIRAMTRRQSDTTDSILTFADITLNRSTYILTGPKNPEGIRLANKEYQMLEMLMANPGQIISADQFMDKIWGYDSDAEQNVVWVYISYLRKKLVSAGSCAQIKAMRGVGYSIVK